MIATAKAYTFASHTSLDSIQSLQKSMLFHTLKENKRSSRHTEKNRKIDDLELMSLEMKKGQLVTCDSAYAALSGRHIRYRHRYTQAKKIEKERQICYKKIFKWKAKTLK